MFSTTNERLGAEIDGLTDHGEVVCSEINKPRWSAWLFKSCIFMPCKRTTPSTQIASQKRLVTARKRWLAPVWSICLRLLTIAKADRFADWHSLR